MKFQQLAYIISIFEYHYVYVSNEVIKSDNIYGSICTTAYFQVSFFNSNAEQHTLHVIAVQNGILPNSWQCENAQIKTTGKY